MATELTVQSERAFQKQPHIFLNPKTKAKSKKVGQARRWYKDVGLGFRTPKTAIEGSYIGMHDSELFSPVRKLRFGDWRWFFPRSLELRMRGWRTQNLQHLRSTCCEAAEIG
jgi:hypothetical protein